MHAPGENPSSFEESIEIDTPMTAQQAAEAIALFHDTSTEAVFSAFINLRNASPSDPVIFKYRYQNNLPLISMEGTTNGTQWHHFIHRYTGQPIQTVG